MDHETASSSWHRRRTRDIGHADGTTGRAAAVNRYYAIPQESVKNWTAQREKFQQIPRADRAKLLGLRRRFIKALHDAGVPFALGSDAPQLWNVPGFSAHRELRSLVDAGLTPYQALRTGTRNVATYFRTESTTGTIAAGKRADLVLLEANPLVNIDNSTRIAGVMVNGHWMSRAEIDKRLADGSLE